MDGVMTWLFEVIIIRPAAYINVPEDNSIHDRKPNARGHPPAVATGYLTS